MKCYVKFYWDNSPIELSSHGRLRGMGMKGVVRDSLSDVSY